jgi:hypothetical protein
MAQSSNSSGGPTEADERLAREATAIGPEPVSAWQVKRWREDGRLPTQRVFLGRGRGSGPVDYPPHAAAHAACLAHALTTYRRLDEATLVCFGRGFTPPERALKRAYARGFDRLTSWLERTADSDKESEIRREWEIADAVAALLARRSAGIPQLRSSRERLRAAGQPPGLLRDVLVNAVTVFLGVADKLNPETLLAFGVDGLLTPIGPNGEALATSHELAHLGGVLRLAAFADAAASATLAELERARDDFADLSDVARTFASVAGRTIGLQLDALAQFLDDELGAVLVGIPGVLLIRPTLGPETFDANLSEFRAQLAQMHATERLLDAMPPDLHRLISPDTAAVAALPQPTRERLTAEIRTYLQAHPDDAILITGEVPPAR